MVKVQSSRFNVYDYVIGVDGGGTKTVCALADMQGKIVAKAKAGASNPRNIGIDRAVKNIARGIQAIIKNKWNINIASVFIGLPAIEEEYKNRKSEIVTRFKKQKGIANINGKIIVGSDQLVAFRAGTDAKNGIIAIAGTGCAVHGWNGDKEAKVNGWGWLADEGSAFWIGQKTFQAILKSFDGRVPDTILEKTALKDLQLKNLDALVDFAYADFAKNVAPLFKVCSDAADLGDKVAREILVAASKEIALSVREVSAKLHFSETVPLVLVGGAYKSHWVLNTVKKEVSRYYPGRFKFIIIEEPVAGAVKLALEATNNP
jgi:N-acetylglucosamine kinase